ncbi:MAG: IS110 family transposase [Acidobacteriota bacterium]|nr:IS110 family transposase [Acidobacteriota bacterium]
MKVVYPRCAGIDVHKESMTVCVIVDRRDGSAPEYHKRQLATHTEGIRQLCAWLEEHQVTDVGMESTGVYWKPVWNALEGKWGLHLCNPQHVRVIPGAKTDMRDGTRVAELLAYGKLPESFIPPAWQRELRDLTRLRARMTQEVSRAGNRILKVLEDAQIKLDCVASDALGVTGRLIIKALLEGKTDAAELAELAVGKLKKKKAQLRQALDGKFTDHHRFQIRLLLKMIQEYESQILELDKRISQYLEPYADAVSRLDEVPGIDRLGAAVILAEIGPDVRHWEDSRKLACWSCLCPGNCESGGKRLSGRTRKGNRWLRRAFCQMAWASTRKKGSYCKTQYRRLAGRRGKQRALLAVAHTLITVVFHLLRDPNLQYRELGEDYFDKRDAAQTATHLIKRLAKLGYEVTLTPKAA